MEPKAQIAYLRLASRMRPPHPPVEALTAFYEAVNRALDESRGGEARWPPRDDDYPMARGLRQRHEPAR
jgi:hypothetical protein